MRQKLRTDDTRHLIFDMCEGNPGALRVLITLAEVYGVQGVSTILHLDDMNIRGEQIWIAFKEYCGCSIEVLKVSASRRDPNLVRLVNKFYLIEEAVVFGGSVSRNH